MLGDMTADRPDIDALLPLPPATFHILLALVDQDRHGYAILQDIEARTEGGLRLSAARSTGPSPGWSSRA